MAPGVVPVKRVFRNIAVFPAQVLAASIIQQPVYSVLAPPFICPVNVIYR